MSQAINILPCNATRPCVQPTRLINRDLSQANAILAELRREALKPGFNPAFQIEGSNKPAFIIDAIHSRIERPWQINQADASLCGPAALMYCLAKDAPQLYVQYMRDLFVHGKARINNLEVEPSLACKTGRISVGTDNKTRQISAVDWIALASLRDSENRLFRHRSVSSQTSGITLPGMLAAWFSAAGYQQVQQKTQFTSSHNVDHLLGAAKDYQHKKNVCLFIAAKVVNGPFSLKVVPNHWVVMSDALRFYTSPNTSSDQTPKPREEQIPSLKAYSWGTEKQELNLSKLNLSDFSKYYFGYVVAS